MTHKTSRYTHMNGWIFEVKSVRAIRTPAYGQPYNGIAHLQFNGDNLYIDSQMNEKGDEFSRRDFMTFYRFAQQMEAKQATYDKMRNGQRLNKTVEIAENISTLPYVRLVK